jgi:hypothetical protein
VLGRLGIGDQSQEPGKLLLTAQSELAPIRSLGLRPALLDLVSDPIHFLAPEPTRSMEIDPGHRWASCGVVRNDSGWDGRALLPSYVLAI